MPGESTSDATQPQPWARLSSLVFAALTSSLTSFLESVFCYFPFNPQPNINQDSLRNNIDENNDIQC